MTNIPSTSIDELKVPIESETGYPYKIIATTPATQPVYPVHLEFTFRQRI